MPGIRSLWRRWFGVDTDADPRLVDALERVDLATREFEAAVEDAKRRGVFDVLRTAVVDSADTDARRIRRNRGRGAR